MKLLIFIVPIIGIFCVLGCKKEKSPFYTNSTFQSSTTATVYPIKLFTKNGEITDTALIRRFVNTYTGGGVAPNNFLFGVNSQIFSYIKLKAVFSGNNNVRIERYPMFLAGQIESHEAEFNLSGNELLIVKEKDSTRTTEYPPIHCNDLVKYSLANYPTKTCVPFPTFPPSQQQLCSFQNSFPLKIRQNQLVLPLIVILVKSGDLPGPAGGCSIYIAYDIWDTFNNNVINNLQPIDTIAIQTKEVLLQKM